MASNKPVKKISRSKAVELAAKGLLTHEEAASLTDNCRQRISQLVQEYKDSPDFKLLTEKKDTVFESLQTKIIQNISQTDLVKANLQQKIWSLGVLQDKVQVLRGQASSISEVDIRGVIGLLAKVEGNTQNTTENNDPPITIDVSD